MTGLLFLLLLWQLCTGAGSLTPDAGRTRHVLFVSVPVPRHVEPLHEIAVTVARSRASTPLRVSFATAAWADRLFSSYAWGPTTVEPILLEAIPLLGGHSAADSAHDRALSNMTREQLRQQFHASMLAELLGRYLPPPGELADNPVDIVVTDRYTFAGYDLAHALGVPLVVHNPWPLLSIDSPPNYVTAEATGYDDLNRANSSSFDTIARLDNLWSRIRNAIAQLQLSHESNREVSEPLGLPRLMPWAGRCSKQLTLSDTVLGWLDEPRPMLPLHQTIGAVVPSQIFTPFRHLPEQLAGAPHAQQFVIQGVVQPWLVETVEAVARRAKAQVSMAGVSCLGHRMLSFCPVGEAGHAGHQSEHVLITTGDLGCVQVAAMCGSFRAIFIWPVLPEHHEVAARLIQSKLQQVYVLPSGPFSTEFFAQTLSRVLSRELDSGTTLAHFGASLRRAGGAKKAAYWIINVLELGFTRFLPVDCDLPWYQQHLLDVYALYMIAVVSIGFILRTSWQAVSEGLAAEFDEDAPESSMCQALDANSGNAGCGTTEPSHMFSTSSKAPPEHFSEHRNSRAPSIRRRQFSYERVVS